MSAEDLQLLIEVRQAIATGRAARVRELAGLSQAEVASLVGVTPAAVSRWEAGIRESAAADHGRGDASWLSRSPRRRTLKLRNRS